LARGQHAGLQQPAQSGRPSGLGRAPSQCGHGPLGHLVPHHPLTQHTVRIQGLPLRIAHWALARGAAWWVSSLAAAAGF